MSPNDTIDKAKARARKAAKKTRADIFAPEAGHALTSHFPFDDFPKAIVAGFWPLVGEIDILPLLRALHKAGNHLALPCTPPTGNPLIFRAWEPEDALKVGPYETREPFEAAPNVTPALVFVPLLAFAQGGLRLGYGGGFYDRTLAQLRLAKPSGVFACGVAYAGQETADIPVDQYDQTLDGVLTEQYFRKFT